MPYRIVHSPQNARLKELRRALRDPAPAPAGGRHGQAGSFVGMEGPKLIAEALRAGLRLDCVFVAQEAEKLIHGLNLPPNTEVLLLPRKLLNSALSTETPQTGGRVLVEPPNWTWAHVLGPQHGGAPLVLVLAGLQDPGKSRHDSALGRSLRRYGHRHPARNRQPMESQGCSRLGGQRLSDAAHRAGGTHLLRDAPEAGVRILGTTVRAASPVNLVDMTSAVALLIGNEGNGISSDLARKVDATVTIPCPGPVESLNAAVAASVILYEAAQQRSALAGGPAEHRGARR